MYEPWNDFFLAEVGAAAALTGLLFVAVSINLKEIVADAALPARAGETIAMLTGTLLAASLMLVPEQEAPWLGVEVGLVAVVTWAATVRLQMVAFQRATGPSRRTLPGRVVVGQLATLPAVLAAVLLMAGSSLAAPVLAFGILATFAVSILNAWVLLVEILR